MSRDAALQALAAELGAPMEGEIRIGGNYRPVVRDGALAFVAGQVPRVGERVVVTGRAGAGTTLAQARFGAQVGALRCLALLQRELGSLERVRRMLRVGVFVQCAPDFTQHSEVGDGASEVFVRVLGPAGTHARTSVGVYQLPKDATVEVEAVAALEDGA